MKKLAKFIKSLFQNYLAIFLVTVNVSFFLYGEPPFFNNEHIHSDDCLVRIHSQLISRHSYTLTEGTLKLLNLPAFILLGILMDLMGKAFSPICFTTNYQIETVLLVLSIAFQWLLVGYIFTKLINNSHKTV